MGRKAQRGDDAREALDQIGKAADAANRVELDDAYRDKLRDKYRRR
jgi:hypothetical protein